VVLVHAGVYRERVAPLRGGGQGQPIVYAAAPGESVVIKGSEVWQPEWRRIVDHKLVFRGELDASLFAGERINPFRTRLKAAPGGQRLSLGQVFVDGQPLREVDNFPDLLATPNTWLVGDDANELTVHFSSAEPSPHERMVEVTTRERIFAPHRRGLGFIHVRGFTMEHCANQFPDRFWNSDSPQAGALGCRAGHHWVIERNTVRFAKSIGIDCGYEGRHDLEGKQPTPRNTGYHLIRGNYISDNGCCGVAGMRSIGTRITGNVIQGNNWNRHGWPETGGIKVHYFVDGVIEGNLIRDNEAYGIWLDNVYRNSRVTRNVVIANRGSAVFLELGAGPVRIDNNVLAHSRPGFDLPEPRADGLSTIDASGVEFVHNLVFGCHRFGSYHRKKTMRRGAGCSRIVLQNNIFLANKAGHLNWPYPGPDATENRVENNLFSPGGEYLLNPWGGTPSNALIDVVEKAIGVRPELWNHVAPRMTLQQWQAVGSWGARNFEASVAEVSLSAQLVLTLDVGDAVRQFTSTPRMGVERDFFGQPLPEHGVLVGPFQRLARGRNTLRLWAVPVAGHHQVPAGHARTSH
jgi:parallel beta-helix repeat protein